jgi:pyruvate formate lyase activating enzyme
MKEAMFYEQIKNAVKCGLCARNCMISEGQLGVCRVRKNIKGKLYSLVY